MSEKEQFERQGGVGTDRIWAMTLAHTEGGLSFNTNMF